MVSFKQSKDDISAALINGGKTQLLQHAGCWLRRGHRIVRKLASVTFEGETREEVRMLVADVEVDGLDRDAWYIWSHEEGMVALCPLPSMITFQLQAGIEPGMSLP